MDLEVIILFSNEVEIIGITPPSLFPPNPPLEFCIETCKTDRLFIPNKKPDILYVLSVSVTISLSNFKIIPTPVGKKLIIEAVKNIKVMYTAAEHCQSVHTAHFKIPFCMFVLFEKAHHEVTDICIAVEYISINKLDCRCLLISTLIFACPILKSCHNCQCESSCDQPVDCCCQELLDPCETSSCQTDLCTVKTYSPLSDCSTIYHNQSEIPGYYGQ